MDDGFVSVSLRGDNVRVTKVTNLVRSSRAITHDCGERCLRVTAAISPRASVKQLKTPGGGEVTNALRLRVLGANVHVVEVACGIPPPRTPPVPPSPPPSPPPFRPPDPWLLPSPPPAPPPLSPGQGQLPPVIMAGSRKQSSRSRTLVLAGLSGLIPIVLAVGAALIVRHRRDRTLRIDGVRSCVRPERVPTTADDEQEWSGGAHGARNDHGQRPRRDQERGHHGDRGSGRERTGHRKDHRNKHGQQRGTRSESSMPSAEDKASWPT